MHIAIFGGGQLARMLILAGTPLGMSFTCLDADPSCAASPIATIIPPDWSTLDLSTRPLDSVHCFTYENENVDVNELTRLAQYKPLFPGVNALIATQDRLHEKTYLTTHGIPTVAYTAIHDWRDLENFIVQVGFPVILKTRRHGYDGKGQIRINSASQARQAYATLSSQAIIAEQFMPFDFEVSLISVRARGGEVAFYPLIRNEHQAGILHRSEAPYLDSHLQTQAEEIAQTLMTAWEYVGTLTIEFFVRDQQLIVNEIAPRVHNSGHWTIEGAETSQFENHLRAITGLPLGSTQVRGPCTMINLLGEPPADLPRLLSIPGCHYHWYGKTPKAKRKCGHITLCAADKRTLAQRVEEALNSTLAIVENTL